MSVINLFMFDLSSDESGRIHSNFDFSNLVEFDSHAQIPLNSIIKAKFDPKLNFFGLKMMFSA